MVRKYAALGVENALVDILFKVETETLDLLGVEKGVMHLVDETRQAEILRSLKDVTAEMEMGGSCSNIIRLLAMFDKSVALAGMVGEDEYGRYFKRRLAELGMEDRVAVSKTGVSGTSIVLISEDGERTMNTNLGASRYYTSDQIPVDVLRNSEYFAVTGYQWDTENQIKAVTFAIDLAVKAGTRIVFDVADPFCIIRHKDDFLSILRSGAIDIVFANRDEAKALLDCEPELAIERLATTVRIAVIKLGREGSLIMSDGRKIRIKGPEVVVKDTTAAGDMYAGGFLCGVLSGMNLDDCGALAARCAEEVITNIGAKISPEFITRMKKVYPALA